MPWRALTNFWLDRARGPGGFFSSGEMHHYAWATGDTLIQVTGIGPFDITYVDPKDDPSAGN